MTEKLIRRNTKKGIILSLSFFAIFIALYFLNFILPLDFALIKYDNYITRIWSWTENMIAIAAIYYIVKLHRLKLFAVIAALLLGITCYFALSLQGNSFIGIITAILVAIIFYAGYLMLENYGIKNETFHIGYLKTLQKFAFGVLIAIPFAAINIVYFIFQSPVHLQNIILSAIFALNPGFQEEIIFRFFLLTFCIVVLKDKLSDRYFTVYSYALMVLPHSLIHLPDLFLENVPSALFIFVSTVVIFGLPMAYLMKKRNLQMAVGFHWCIDFFRFFMGY